MKGSLLALATMVSLGLTAEGLSAADRSVADLPTNVNLHPAVLHTDGDPGSMRLVVDGYYGRQDGYYGRRDGRFRDRDRFDRGRQFHRYRDFYGDRFRYDRPYRYYRPYRGFYRDRFYGDFYRDRPYRGYYRYRYRPYYHDRWSY